MKFVDIKYFGFKQNKMYRWYVLNIGWYVSNIGWYVSWYLLYRLK